MSDPILKMEDIPEYFLRMHKLMDAPRSMSCKAAKIVVLSAMYGTYCLEGTVRAKIELDKSKMAE